jgi:hypothetical protein
VTTQETGASPPENPKAQEFQARAQRALRDQRMTVQEAWMRGLPPTHRLLRNQEVYAIATKGAQQHASEEEILRMAGRLLNQDWGNIRFHADILQNEEKVRSDRGLILGICQAEDGTELWAMQSHRFVPPTVMLPEER